MQNSYEEKRKFGRPPVVLEKCMKEMKKLTGDMDEFVMEEVIEIKTKLKSLGYNEKMIGKARVALGYVGVFNEVFQSWITTKKYSPPPKRAQLKIDLAPVNKAKVDPRY